MNAAFPDDSAHLEGQVSAPVDPLLSYSAPTGHPPPQELQDALITQAFTAAFTDHKDKLYYFILKITGENIAARDILQDAFLRFWENRYSIDWSQQDIRPLLFTCIRRLIIDYARKKNKRLQLIGQLAAASNKQTASAEVELSYDVIHRRRQLEDFLSQQPEKREKIFRLIKEENLSHKEVAEKLGLSLADVKKQISLSLRGLRKEMNG